MPLTAHQVTLIKQSWRILRNVSPEIVGDLFYSKLFMDHPALRKLFPKGMQEQNRKLADILNTMVMRLDNTANVLEEIAAMARRHTNYDIKQAHYKSVGHALLWTLQKGLGVDWTPEVKESWYECYNLLSNIMIEASGYSERVKLTKKSYQ